MKQQSRSREWSRRTALSVIFAAAAFLPAALDGSSQSGKDVEAGSLPAHDLHQGLLIAVDAYLTSERSGQTFGKKHPYGAGILALDVYLRNDSEGPLQVDPDTFELKVAPPGQSRQRIEPLTAEEAAFRIVLPNGPKLKQRRSPLPGLGGGVSGKSKEVAKVEESLRAQMLPGAPVGARRTVHGFVFFDVDHHFEWVKDATLVVPDVSRVGSGEKLFFFEIDLGPATR